MRSGGGVIKGHQYERELCRLLSLYWSNGETKELFWRTDSGASSTFRKSKSMAGDIVQLIEEDTKKYPVFPFCVEAKFYKDFNLEEILRRDNEKSQIICWLNQAIEEAERSQKYTMLIMKRNRAEAIVIFSEYSLKKTRDDLRLYKWVSFMYKEKCFLMMNLKDFLTIETDSFNVFKNKDGIAYDSTGIIFKNKDGMGFQNSKSRVNIKFPYYPTVKYVKVKE